MTHILIVMFVLAVTTSTGAEAAPRKSVNAEVWRMAAVAARAITPARPAWAGLNDCFTDDGYGRFTPCSLACGGR